MLRPYYTDILFYIPVPSFIIMYRRRWICWKREN